MVTSNQNRSLHQTLHLLFLITIYIQTKKKERESGTDDVIHT